MSRWVSNPRNYLYIAQNQTGQLELRKGQRVVGDYSRIQVFPPLRVDVQQEFTSPFPLYTSPSFTHNANEYTQV